MCKLRVDSHAKDNNMARWLVTVTADIPYPWTRIFSVERSTAAAAASDGVKRYRKAVKEKCMKAKKLDPINIRIERAEEIK